MAKKGTRQSLSAPDIAFKDEKMARLMQFVRDLTSEVQALQQMLRGGDAGQILSKTGAGDYEGAWEGEGGGVVTGAQNEGSGEGLFIGFAGTLLAFKSLIAGTGIKLVSAADSLTIVNTGSGGGGGSGTVTSVGIDSTDLTVAGSPVTVSGSIELEIAGHAVTYAKMQEPVLDAIVLGRAAGAGPGDFQELDRADLVDILGNVGGYPTQLGYAGIV